MPASPPARPRASSGSSASSAVEWRKKIVTRVSTARIRGDWRTNCTPTRIALIRRSRPSGLGWCSWRQRRITKARQQRQHRVEREHPDAAGAGDQRSGDQRPDDAREVHRHAVERQRRGELMARHQLRNDRREDRPAQRQADAVEEHEHQQPGRGHHSRARWRRTGRSPSPRARTGSRPASAGGRACRRERRWAGRGGTPAGSRPTGPARPRSACSSSVVIVHAAATSFIHMHRLAVSQVLQSRRKTGTLNGSSALAGRGDGDGRESRVASSGGIDDMGRSFPDCPGR